MKTRIRIVPKIVVAACLIIVAGTACSAARRTKPEEVARQWYAAVGGFDTARMYQLTHHDRRADLEKILENPLTTVGTLLGLQERKYFSMQYTVVFQDEQAAQVHVSGKVSNRLGHIDSVNETLELRLAEGEWAIWSCSGWF